MLTQLSPRCYFLPHASRDDRPALGYIRGDRFSLQIDCGNSPAHLTQMQEELRRLALPLPALYALTHSHWDHTFAMAAVSAPVIACRETQLHLEAMARWRWTLGDMKTRVAQGEDAAFCFDYMLEAYPDPSAIVVRAADVVFDERMTLSLGGITVRLLRLPNSHRDDCVVALAEEDGVLFTGDITYEDLNHVPPCYHRRRFMALREALGKLPFTLVVPGHQKPMTRAEFFADLNMALQGDSLVLDD